jgi:hypothetical protein
VADRTTALRDETAAAWKGLTGDVLRQLGRRVAGAAAAASGVMPWRRATSSSSYAQPPVRRFGSFRPK